ncbi:TerD family protein [Nocardia sp. NBC_01503]|uniref:TerD family protein n=1 Tax=Nocardia sp. NBC_01503 TaxID=2975997 RepID=UPI002E7B1512|nr:TerD family protein [Nocardia sp. NBC_01503]WTL34869.1 TerD family protein [Nocardia sp. NBC_01503]
MSAALVKGQNGSLTVNDVVIGVQIAAPADLSALLVTETGKVRSDADFVFFNQPSGPGVNLQPGSSGQPASLVISLGAVPAGIQQIRAVITLDEAGNNFGRIPAPVATVSDLGGNPLYEYRIEGLDTESIVIALEVYRRQGGWKVRAVGQGYAGGFAALVTDHGVQVSQAQSQPVEPAAPAGAYPPAAPGYPPQAPAAAPAPVSDPSSDRDLPKNHSVSLAKGQRINLRKEGGAALAYVKMGLGWDPVKRGGMFGNRAPDIDLDASVVMFADTSPVDVVYYGSLAAKDGSIRHQGDNLTGEGEGDDEVIVVDLTRISNRVTTLLFIVTSYKGHTFEQVANAFCRLVDGTNNAELARYTMAGGMPFTGMAMAKVYRTGNTQDWKLEALGEGFQAKHPGEAVPQLGRFLH